MLALDAFDGDAQLETSMAQESSPEPADSNVDDGGIIPVGRTLESQRARQAIYLGVKTEGFSADEAPGDVIINNHAVCRSAGSVIKLLLMHNTHRNHFNDCDSSNVAMPPNARSFIEPWTADGKPSATGVAARSTLLGAPMPSTPARSPLSSSAHLKTSDGFRSSPFLAAGSAFSGGRSPGSLGGSLLSPTGRKGHDQVHDLALNCLDEHQLAETEHLWWKSSRDRYTHDQLQDVPPDMFMEICYPQQGFYVKMSESSVQRYAWNERFQSVFNVAETPERRVRMADFVRDFSAEAVPFAMEVLANLAVLPTPIVHKNGITVEVPWLMPSMKYMFGSDRIRSMKLANREYNGRHFASVGACPQLNVPFTLLVEYVGVKALVYPRLPLKNEGAPPPLLHVNDGGFPILTAAVSTSGPTVKPSSARSEDELVYGLHRPEWFHAEDIQQSDSEVNAVIQRLAMLIRCKGCWLGKEFTDKKFVHGPVDMQVFRSALDNRIYARTLGRLSPSNVASRDGAGAADEEDDSSGMLSSSLPHVSNDYFLHRFRPEFVRRHQRVDLSAESCSPVSKINTERDEVERRQHVELLLSYIIPQAAEQLSRDVRLNGITWPFFLRGGMSEFLHMWGINMRHIVLVHRKLVRTKLSGLALKFVEIEMVARALKMWVIESTLKLSSNGDIREYDLTDHILMVLVPFTDDFWNTHVWPSVLKKYPAFARKTAQKWEPSRVEHAKVVQRLLRLIGAVAVLHETDALCDRLDWVKTVDEAHQLRIRYFPVVQCPSYPKAPLEEGQDVHLMILAKRYLREVTFDLKYNPVANRDMLDRYVSFLEQMGERNCEEITGFYVAEQERKDRVLKGAKPSYAEAGKDERTIKYRLKDNRGMRVIEIARDALERFKFYHNQKVQQTLGADAGVISTIVGSIDGVLFHHEDGADGATELFGRNYSELQGNYGFVLLDKLMYLRRAQLLQLHSGSSSLAQAPNVSPADVALKQPYHQVGDRGLLIFETSADILLDNFGVESGQRLMFVQGPRRGIVTTVLGAIDGNLVHHIDGATQCDTIRMATSDQQTVASDDGGASSLGDTQDSRRHSIRAVSSAFQEGEVVTLARTTPAYPMDTTMVYCDKLDIFAGYRSCVQLGFFYRQLILCQSGPFAGQRGVILGAHAGHLQCLFPFRHLAVSLGNVHAEIVEQHDPQIVGVLSYDPQHEPAPTHVLYPGLGGDPLSFDVTYSACLPLGGVRGQRIKVLFGHLAGLCGFVVGSRQRRLWAQLDGESGAQPLVEGSFVITRGSIFVPDRSIDVPEDSVSEAHLLSVFPPKSAHGLSDAAADTDSQDITFYFLAAFGEVVAFDASPTSCDRFGFYHSQRLRIQRRPRTCVADLTLTADVIFVVVVGVFHNELFYVAEGEPCARPFGARNRWHLEWMYAPDVVGLRRLEPWSDVFCGDRQRVQSTAIDPFFEDNRIQLAYCEASQSVLGLDTTGLQALHATWRAGTTIVRQDRIVTEVLPSGVSHHRPDGPQATVVGAFDGVIYIELRSDYSQSVGRANATSALCRVRPLPARACAKWLPCAGWKHHKQKTFLSPEEVCKSDDYETRLALEASASPTFSYWWGYLEELDSQQPSKSAAISPPAPESTASACDEAATVPPERSDKIPQLTLFSREISQCLEKLFEKSHGTSGSHYDVDGGSYFIETMTYTLKNVIEDTAVTYRMTREPLETVNSYCAFRFRVDLRSHFPLLHDALLSRVTARLRGRAGMAVREVAIRRQRDIVFARDEIGILHEVCDATPTLLLNALRRVIDGLPVDRVRQTELRYASMPEPLKRPTLLWVLSLLGIPCSDGTESLKDLYALLAAMELSIGRVTDVPTLEEFDAHAREQLSALTEFEGIQRLTLLQEELNWWQRQFPRSCKRFVASTHLGVAQSTAHSVQRSNRGNRPKPLEALDAYDDISVRVMRSCLSIAKQKFAALMAHKTAHNVQCAQQLPMVYRFTLQDGATVIMEPSSMAFQRGDVVEYTLGDIAGIRATILGMYGGYLWRYEHSGVYRNVAMPFSGSEEDIQQRYQLRMVRREDPVQVRLGDASVLHHQESNVIPCLCFDGVVRDMDPSYRRLAPYGVCSGDRLVTTAETDIEAFPFENLVVVIFGACSNGRIWFAVDQTGLLPFPESDCAFNIVQRYALRLVYNCPARQPPHDASKLMPCQGVVGPAEGAVIGRIGPMTLVFLTAKGALPARLQSGAKVAIQSGDNKGRRLMVVGMRHGKLWVLWEHDAAARPLKDVASLDIKVLNPDASGGFRSLESTTSLATVPQPTAAPAPDAAWFRFPTQRGGLAQFQTNCMDVFHLQPGQQVAFSVARKHGLPKKKAIIVGMRDGALWKVDEFESEAKPFIGATDLAALQKKFDIAPGPIVGIESVTW